MSRIIIFILIPIIAIVLVILNYFIAPHRPIFNKLGVVESGIRAATNQSRIAFNIVFYITAVLFLAFDLELILIWPLVTVLSITGIYGFWIATIFFAILTLGFVIEISSGALKF